MESFRHFFTTLLLLLTLLSLFSEDRGAWAAPSKRGFVTEPPSAEEILSHVRRAAVEVNMTSEIADWNSYRYDSRRDNSIRDGGDDMFDNGNMVSYSVNENSYFSHGPKDGAPYNRTFNFEDHAFTTIASHPFMAFLWVRGYDVGHMEATIQVQGNAGADNHGEIVGNDLGIKYFDGYKLQYGYSQVSQSATDPSICEVYFVLSSTERWDSEIVEEARLQHGDETNVLKSSYHVIGHNYLLGYVLLSRKEARPVSEEMISNAVQQLALRLTTEISSLLETVKVTPSVSIMETSTVHTTQQRTTVTHIFTPRPTTVDYEDTTVETRQTIQPITAETRETIFADERLADYSPRQSSILSENTEDFTMTARISAAPVETTESVEVVPEENFTQDEISIGNEQEEMNPITTEENTTTQQNEYIEQPVEESTVEQNEGTELPIQDVVFEQDEYTRVSVQETVSEQVEDTGVSVHETVSEQDQTTGVSVQETTIEPIEYREEPVHEIITESNEYIEAPVAVEGIPTEQKEVMEQDETTGVSFQETTIEPIEYREEPVHEIITESNEYIEAPVAVEGIPTEQKKVMEEASRETTTEPHDYVEETIIAEYEETEVLVQETTIGPNEDKEELAKEMITEQNEAIEAPAEEISTGQNEYVKEMTTEPVEDTEEPVQEVVSEQNEGTEVPVQEIVSERDQYTEVAVQEIGTTVQEMTTEPVEDTEEPVQLVVSEQNEGTEVPVQEIDTTVQEMATEPVEGTEEPVQEIVSDQVENTGISVQETVSEQGEYTEVAVQETNFEQVENTENTGVSVQEIVSEQVENTEVSVQETVSEQNKGTEVPVQEMIAEQNEDAEEPVQETVSSEQNESIKDRVEEITTEQNEVMDESVQEVVSEQNEDKEEPVEEITTEGNEYMEEHVQELTTEQNRVMEEPVQELLTEQNEPIEEPVEETVTEQNDEMEEPSQESTTEPNEYAEEGSNEVETSTNTTSQESHKDIIETSTYTPDEDNYNTILSNLRHVSSASNNQTTTTYETPQEVSTESSATGNTMDTPTDEFTNVTLDYSPNYVNEVLHQLPNGTYVPLTRKVIFWELVQTINRTTTGRIRDNIQRFYRYSYDGGDESIHDGGQDMYDIGNMVKFTVDDGPEIAVRYNEFYYGDNYMFASATGHPFFALAFTDLDSTHRYNITVHGNAGADGDGRVFTWQRNITERSCFIQYNVFQLSLSADTDPSICEVYFTVSCKEWNSVLNESQFLYMDDGNELRSQYIVSGTRVLIGYMLLSKPLGSPIRNPDVENSVRLLVRDLNYKETRVSKPKVNEEEEVEVEMEQIESMTQFESTSVVDGTNRQAVVQKILHAIEEKTSKLMHSFIPNFYDYYYDSVNGNSIADGGNDMYDGGNMVYFGQNITDFGGSTLVNYNRIYNESDFAYGTVSSHPFTAVMWTNSSTNDNSATYSLEVRGNAGADHAGDIERLQGTISLGNYGLDYFVYQISQASNDPSICEVYFVVHSEAWGSSGHHTTEFSHTQGSENLWGVLKVTGDKLLLGYTLLSRENGGKIQEAEIKAALRPLLLEIATVTSHEPVLTPQAPEGDYLISPTCLLSEVTNQFYKQCLYEGAWFVPKKFNGVDGCRSELRKMFSCAERILLDCSWSINNNNSSSSFDIRTVQEMFRLLASPISAESSALDVFCHHAPLGLSFPFSTQDYLHGACNNGVTDEIRHILAGFYRSYVWARNEQDITTAYDLAGSLFTERVGSSCSFDGLSTSYPEMDIEDLNNFLQVLINSITNMKNQQLN